MRLRYLLVMVSIILPYSLWASKKEDAAAREKNIKTSLEYYKDNESALPLESAIVTLVESFLALHNTMVSDKKNDTLKITEKASIKEAFDTVATLLKADPSIHKGYKLLVSDLIDVLTTSWGDHKTKKKTWGGNEPKKEWYDYEIKLLNDLKLQTQTID